MRMRALWLAATIVISGAGLAQSAKGPAQPAASDALAPIAWMVGDWHATAQPASGKAVQVDNHIYYSETRTAIFFLTRFDGVPHYSGMYAFDNARKQIAFWYVDSGGTFTEGTARFEGKRLIQEFTITETDGTKQTLKAWIDRAADDKSYHWQVLRGEEAKPLIELDYTRKK